MESRTASYVHQMKCIKKGTLILSFIILLFISATAFGQMLLNSNKEIESLFENQDFNGIIGIYAKEDPSYGATDYYRIGYSFYMKEDDNNCFKYMSKSIEKDPSKPEPYFFAGTSLCYSGKFESALGYLRKALAMNPNHVQTVLNTAKCYQELKHNDSALIICKSFLEKNPGVLEVNYFVAAIYNEANQLDSAFVYYQASRKDLKPTNKSYAIVNYNYGLCSYILGKYPEAESAFKDCFAANPNDFMSVSKVIQALVAQGKTSEIKEYKQKMYNAEKAGLLKDELGLQFCIDQFQTNGTKLMVFERYQEKSDKIFEKTIFYVLKTNGEIDYKIVTEYSPILSESGKNKYVLCSWKNDIHYNYGISFDDETDYYALKKIVIDVISGNVKPAATTILPTGKDKK